MTPPRRGRRPRPATPGRARGEAMTELRCKVLIIGGGPGGYVAAIRAGELGLDTVLVEDGRFGGDLPACRLHPVEGDHPRGRRRSTRSPSRSALNAIGVALGAACARLRQNRSPGRTRSWRGSPSGVGALLKKAQVRSLRGRATHRRRQERDRPRRHRRPENRLRASRHRDRFGAGATRRAAVRRRGSCPRPRRWR